MKKHILSIVTGFIIALTFVLVPATTISAVEATSTNSGQALEIAPPVMILTADPGQTIQTKITLRSISKAVLSVKSQINDFVAEGEDGTPKILFDGSTETSIYSIKNWVEYLPDLTLKSRQIEDLPLVINVPSNAAPGGYYGVVRFTANPAELDSTGVSLSASLGALILLRINGDVKENLTIEEFSASKKGITGTIFESTPIQFTVRLKNSGNIHEQPTGQATIIDMFNKKIATVNINTSSNNILPDSIRKFESPLDSSVIGNKMLFGRYTANLKITYGTDKQVITQTITFWVIPFTLIGICIILIVGGFLTLRFLIKRYNRHIRNQALGIKRSKKNKK